MIHLFIEKLLTSDRDIITDALSAFSGHFYSVLEDSTARHYP